MLIRCHFWYYKSLLFLSLTHVDSTIASAQTLTLLTFLLTDSTLLLLVGKFLYRTCELMIGMMLQVVWCVIVRMLDLWSRVACFISICSSSHNDLCVCVCVSSDRKELPYGSSPNIRQCHSHPCTSPTLSTQYTDTSSKWKPSSS